MTQRMVGRAAMFLVAALVVASPPAAAQGMASVSGLVKDSGGGLLPGATVTALNTASGSLVVAVAGEGGAFAFKGLTPGPYRLTASLPGFSEAGRTVTLAAGQVAAQDFTLSVGTLSEQITVTAAKGARSTAEIPQVVTVISSADLADRRPASPQEAYERAPNVRTIDTNPYRARPQFRGLSSSRVLIVVDGERLNNTRFDVGAGGVSPSLVDMSQIESIEVVGGSASSLYGSDAVAGTINILTRNPVRPNAGSVLDLKVDMDWNANSDSLRGTFGAAFATPRFAVRGNLTKFDQGSYHSGAQALTIADSARIGQFVSNMGVSVGRTIATGWSVFDFAEGGEVVNGEADGVNGSLDVWLYPTERQSVRVKYLINRQNDLGLPFSKPPFDPFQRTSAYSNLDKVTARYESRELRSWLSRLSIGVYRQKFDRPQNDIRSDILAGSSYIGNTLTGSASTYTGVTNNTETVNSITSTGGDLQLNILPFANAVYTTGVAFLQDQSRDTFNRRTFTAAGAPILVELDRKSTPDSDYRNLGWFHQLEWTPANWLRLSGGARLDNWHTVAKPSAGFPPGNEFAALTAALPALTANPGAINLAGINGVAALAAGTGELTSDSTIWTGNLGATLILPGGLNPYARLATSFREPEITARYIMRNFGAATVSVIGVPNTELKPETGKNLDVGVKYQGSRARGTLGYFRNDLTDAVATVFSPSFCVPASPAAGVSVTPFPPCVLTGQHSASFFQRVNFAKARLDGWEATGEASFALGGAGSLTPFVSLSWIKGQNLTPDTAKQSLIRTFYNRTDTPIELEAAVDDVPFADVIPFQGAMALKYTPARGRWFAEYELRWAPKITRVDPDTVASANLTQYLTILSLDGFNKQSIRGGYTFGADRTPLRLTVGLENLTNRFIVLPFQNGPSPGRTFVMGLTVELKNLLGQP